MCIRDRSTVEAAPCWPRNCDEPLTVADWILNLTWVLVYAFCFGQHRRLPTRARSRSSVAPAIEEAPSGLEGRENL
eukprot:6675780-Pyramimonas_sp.AAC.1